MERRLPSKILNILEQWFSISITCVKWNGCVSSFFRLMDGVRQGGVLTPFLFAIFIDNLVDKVKATGVGCYLLSFLVSIFLYADDILLIVPSVSSLQKMLIACETELKSLDMQINSNKSMCIRFGPRFNVDCECLRTSQGGLLQWTNQSRYSGIYLVSGRSFKFSLEFRPFKKPIL